MLQDDDDDHLTRALALNACYNFYLTATEEDFKSIVTEEDDEDIVRAKHRIIERKRPVRYLGESESSIRSKYHQ